MQKLALAFFIVMAASPFVCITIWLLVCLTRYLWGMLSKRMPGRPSQYLYAGRGASRGQPRDLIRLHLQRIDAQQTALQLLRARTLLELEPATNGASADAHQVRLRSVRSSLPQVTLTFCNSTTRRVCIIWMNTSGDEIVLSAPICILLPGATSLWHSYCSHPWIARDATTGERMMVGERRQAHVVHLSDAGLTFHITEPPSMLWTMQTHRYFPPSHRGAVRALLLSHKRLQSALCLVPPLPPPPPPAPLMALKHKQQHQEQQQLRQPGPGDVILWIGPLEAPACVPLQAALVSNQSASVGGSTDAAWAALCEAHAAAVGLERLPSALVLVIIGFMVPEVLPLQDVEAHPHGHDDILPALLGTATVTITVT